MPPFDNIQRNVEVIDQASRHARMLFYFYLGLITYCLITVISTTHSQLALTENMATLPIFRIQVPLDGFFIVGPFLSIALFIYFMIYLRRLNSLIEELGESFDNKHLYPWIINMVKDPDTGFAGCLEKVIVFVSLWCTLPITLFIFSFWYLAKHEEYKSYLIVGLFFVSIYIVIVFWHIINKKSQNATKIIFKNPLTNVTAVLIFLTTALFILTVVKIIPDINNGNYYWTNLSLNNQILTTFSTNNRAIEPRFVIDLQDKNFNGAHMYDAILTKANLKRAKLKGAILTGAVLNDTGLTEADLTGAELRGSNLTNALLRKATLINTNLNNSILVGANLNETNLQNARNLSFKQLCSAGTLYNAKNIDEKLLSKITSNKECAYKLTKQSHDKWQEKMRADRQIRALKTTN